MILPVVVPGLRKKNKTPLDRANQPQAESRGRVAMNDMSISI